MNEAQVAYQMNAGIRDRRQQAGSVDDGIRRGYGVLSSGKQQQSVAPVKGPLRRLCTSGLGVDHFPSLLLLLLLLLLRLLVEGVLSISRF